MEWHRARFFILTTAVVLFAVVTPLWLSIADGMTTSYRLLSLPILLIVFVLLALTSFGAGAALHKLISLVVRYRRT
jgi:hypothetical protein